MDFPDKGKGKGKGKDMDRMDDRPPIHKPADEHDSEDSNGEDFWMGLR